MNDNNEGVEVEAAPTCRFFGATEDNNSEDSIDQLPDTTDDDIESDWGAPSSSEQQNKQSNTCSNIKFYLLLLATFAIFLGVGIGELVYCLICVQSSSSWVDTDYG